MDTGEAVVDEDDEEGDALFAMDDLVDGAANAKKENTDEVRLHRLRSKDGPYQFMLLHLIRTMMMLVLPIFGEVDRMGCTRRRVVAKELLI